MLIFKNYNLKPLTRVRVGGICSCFCEPSLTEEVISAVHYALDSDIPIFVLGGGTNLLVQDGFINALIIRLSGAFKNYSLEGGLVRCGGAVPLKLIGLEFAKRGYLGCQFMAHIPGTVGGAVAMNAGTTNEGEIKDCFQSAFVLDCVKGNCLYLNHQALKFCYRNSSLNASNRILLEACFNVPDNQESYSGEAIERIRKVRKIRRKKQPRNSCNFGSVFKKPVDGNSAGWYLERVGMKGEKQGDAMVPDEHANWIVNVAEASFSDVKTLIERGQKRVYERYGVSLEREVIFFPEEQYDW